MTRGEVTRPPDDVVEIEYLADCWLAMAQATTLDEIEAATLKGLVGIVDVEIAYTARLQDAVWTIIEQVGLEGNIVGVAVPEDQAPYAESLRAGQALCYENPEEMGPELAAQLATVNVLSLYAFPIMKDDVCIGALVIGNHQPSLFSPRDRALVRMFASHLSTLRRNRELVQSLETLAENVPVIVLRTEANGWINWYNKQWYKFTGQTHEEAAGWGWQTAHHPEDFLRVMEEWPLALATGKPIEIEFRLKRYDGIYNWFLARVDPVHDDRGTIVSWYGSVSNIEAQKQALERTKRVADTLQNAFLPSALPQRTNLHVDATYISAEEDALVGGDWYDAFDLPDGRLGFSIGDVTGHGIAASMAVGKLRQAIFTLSLTSDDPAHILAQVNRILQIQEPGTFVTALVGFIDPDETSMRYAAAGHPPPLVAYRAGEPATLMPTGGPPLGVTAEFVADTHRIAIEKDMVVALYTDGMTEFAHDAIEGERRLAETLSTLVGNGVVRPSRMVYNQVLDGVPPPDDAALLIFAFSPVSTLGRTDEPGLQKEWRFHASDAQAAHVARREIGAYIRSECGDNDETFATELIIGELLANTVEHAPGLVHLLIDWPGDYPVLIVRDSGPGMELMRTDLPVDPLDEGKRGLFLVGKFSKHATLEKSPSGGAELRVVLPIRRA